MQHHLFGFFGIRLHGCLPFQEVHSLAIVAGTARVALRLDLATFLLAV
jgi:hypothetical protein